VLDIPMCDIPLQCGSKAEVDKMIGGKEGDIGRLNDDGRILHVRQPVYHVERGYK
jgi:hypothetical protein